MSEIERCGLQTIYETPYTCTYCGDHIAVGWAFCPECGTSTGQGDAELEREKNELTCEGCANMPTKYGSGVYMNAPCRICVRGITTRDYYKSAVEPKGEKA